MNVEPHQITIRELTSRYTGDGEGGVRGSGGRPCTRMKSNK